MKDFIAGPRKDFRVAVNFITQPFGELHSAHATAAEEVVILMKGSDSQLRNFERS